jgi:hypothetical protein
MRAKNKIHTILKEWDAFCRPLIEGTKAVDSRKSLTDFQKADQHQDYSKVLDLYLQLFFESPASALHPDIFVETPPVLEAALTARIVHATKLLTEILERHGDLHIPSESDPTKTIHLSFRELLLPSPPY